MWMVNVQYQTNFTTSFYILLPIVAATTANTAVHASNMSSFKSWPCACWSMYTNASCRYCIEKEKCKSNYKISEEFAFNKNPKRYTKYYVNFTRRRYKFIVIQTLNVFFLFCFIERRYQVVSGEDLSLWVPNNLKVFWRNVSRMLRKRCGNFGSSNV